MDYIHELSDDCNVEHEVIERVHYKDLIINTLTDIEKAAVGLQLSNEYQQQDISNIMGMSHTSIWALTKNALAKLRRKIESDDETVLP